MEIDQDGILDNSKPTKTKQVSLKWILLGSFILVVLGAVKGNILSISI
jgi:hypothetical protein